ncbi:MAG: transcription elongation factor GreA [Patescibacteria group bacterium]|jgi:transcription elongation factor GreA
MAEVYYVSKEGLEKLQEELSYRSGVYRKKISEKIGTAKDQGDLGENFEYQEAKEEQAQNETRVIQIRDMMARAVIVEEREGEGIIHLGTRFTVELPSGTKKDFQIVGATEGDPMQGKISNDSPLGNAFLGKKPGEAVELKLPNGSAIYKIVSVI